MVRTRRMAWALITAAALVVSTGSAASASPDDARAQEELAATGEQDAFGRMLIGLLERFPEQIVDFTWTPDGGQILATHDAADAVEGFVAVESPGTRVTTARPEVLPYHDRQTIEMAVLDTYGGLPSEAIGARYDPVAHAVIVSVWTDSPARVADFHDDHATTTGRLWSDVPILVEYEPPSQAPVTDSDTRGGFAYSSCTGGFVATRGAAYGITTSAHCTFVPTAYDGDNTGSTYVASSNRDVRFTVLTGGTPKNEFRYDFGVTRPITGVGAVSVGQSLSVFGKESGYGATSVESYKGCVLFTSGDTWCYLYYTQTRVTTGGDSGGPWFLGFTGYGFTTGSNSGGSYITTVASTLAIPGGVDIKTS